MYHRASSTPDTLPGIDGAEIPVQRLLATLTEYEKLAAQSRVTYTVSIAMNVAGLQAHLPSTQLAKSTADDLRSVLSVASHM